MSTNTAPQSAAAKSAAKPIPDRFTSITPYLTCADASAALDFYAKAFGAIEHFRLTGPNGKVMNAQLQIGNAMIMVMDEAPEWGALGPKALKGTSVTIHIYVTDVDAAYERAVQAGATAKMPPMEMFWGDRYGWLEDPFGHSWSIATHKQDLTKAEIEANMVAQMSAQCGAPQS